MIPVPFQALLRPTVSIGLAGFVALIGLGTLGCFTPETEPTRTGSPADALPPHITPLLDAGVRPDWSADGTRLLFLDDLVGSVYELDLRTRETRPLTDHFTHHGFTRARYLANDALLLCGPGAPTSGTPEPDASDPADAPSTGPDLGGAPEDPRRWRTELWYLGAAGTSPAIALGAPCFEGPAVSRNTLRIAWTVSDYPERVVFGRSEIWTAEIALGPDGPSLVDRRRLVDRSDFYYLAFLESQDFRPPNDRELLFTAYAYKAGEVMGVDLETGTLTNYSQNWAYDEAEGVFPNGDWIAVEREPHTYSPVPGGRIDIWRTRLDGSATTERLTYFTDFAGYGANNPVISPDGRYMAFGLRILGGAHGNGQGVYLFDFEKWEAGRRTTEDARRPTRE